VKSFAEEWKRLQKTGDYATSPLFASSYVPRATPRTPQRKVSVEHQIASYAPYIPWAEYAGVSSKSQWVHSPTQMKALHTHAQDAFDACEAVLSRAHMKDQW